MCSYLLEWCCNYRDWKGGRVTINITKIKYIMVLHKVYSVMDISFSDMTIKAVEADASIVNIPEDEIFNVMELSEFQITLVNNDGQANIIEFEAWKREHLSKMRSIDPSKRARKN